MEPNTQGADIPASIFDLAATSTGNILEMADGTRFCGRYFSITHLREFLADCLKNAYDIKTIIISESSSDVYLRPNASRNGFNITGNCQKKRKGRRYYQNETEPLQTIDQLCNFYAACRSSIFVLTVFSNHFPNSPIIID